ncbi:MAG: HAD-IIIA family hydrolase [Kiritimatiellae bacterium]|nr:HAD-IIIA family hydrolase [Kiritimatiellia bacterium]
MAASLRPAVFFDRDGIANVSPGPGYVNRLADFHIRPAFLDAVAAAASRGWPSVVVTNQRGVSRGLTPPAELEAMHAALRDALAARGLALLDILVCTANDPAHPDRKPNPGLFLKAAARHHLDLSRSWMVGDRESDVLAGRNAGLATTVLVDDDGLPRSTPDSSLLTPSLATHRLPSLSLLPPLLLSSLQPP